MFFFLQWVWWWFVCQVSRSASQRLEWRIYQFINPASSHWTVGINKLLSIEVAQGKQTLNLKNIGGCLKSVIMNLCQHIQDSKYHTKKGLQRQWILEDFLSIHEQQWRWESRQLNFIAVNSKPLNLQTSVHVFGKIEGYVLVLQINTLSLFSRKVMQGWLNTKPLENTYTMCVVED